MKQSLTPSDCDLRGLGYMPLDVQRLRDSDLALSSTGDEFKAAVLLWCVSWSQVPAASLPDDDRLLAALVRLDHRAWRKVRTVALRGWEKCSDGRLYHSVVAEKACEAWEERVHYRAKRDKDRDRLKAWREGQKPTPKPDGPGPGNGHETGSETRFDTHFETQPEEKGTWSEGIEEPPNPPRGDSFAQEFLLAWLAYPEAGRSTIGQAQAWPSWLRAAAVVGHAALLAAVKAYAVGDYAANGGKPMRFDRWLDKGGYEAFIRAAPNTPSWLGPPEIRTAVMAAIGPEGDAWAKSWLDRCRWRDLPDRAVLAENNFIAERLKRDIGAVLDGLGVSILVEAVA